MNEAPSIQWFPGHMAKTRRLIRDCLPLVDAVVEITDARIPMSSRNPELDRLCAKKPRIVILNKCDMADDRATAAWLEYYRKEKIAAMAADCRSGKNVNRFLPLVRETLSELIERRNAKGMVGRPIRVMVVGIPNVGKSSFINRMAGKKKAGVEDRPGVTRTKQWVALDKDIELLDMPGVLWPKFEDSDVACRLAFTGAVKDDVLDIEALASLLMKYLGDNYPEALCERYKITLDNIPEEDEMTSAMAVGYEILTEVGRKRGMLISGGEVNTERAAITVLDEYRSGKIGSFTLELPPKKG